MSLLGSRLQRKWLQKHQKTVSEQSRLLHKLFMVFIFYINSKTIV